MNILFINDFPFPNAGGVGRVTETLAQEFLKIGESVSYIALRKGTSFKSNGVVQHFSPSNKIFSKENIGFLKNFLQKNNIDLIINQGGSKPDVLKTILNAKKEKTKLISVLHGCVIGLQENYRNIIRENYRNSKFRPLITNPLSLLILKRLSRRNQGKNYLQAITYSDKFVLLSESYREELKYYIKNFPFEKTTAIPNPLGLNFNGVDFSKKENRLVFVGRINYSEKQAHLLLKIWKCIWVDFPDWHFDIVGDGPKLLDLKNKAKAQNLKNIHFHGYKDPRPYLEKAKIFCLTSAFEGFGLVLVEAQAYGVVPLAFYVTSGIRDIINDGINGLLIKPFDLGQYESALRGLMKDGNQLNLMAAAGIINAERFKKTKIIQKWITLINEVMAE